MRHSARRLTEFGAGFASCVAVLQWAASNSGPFRGSSQSAVKHSGDIFDMAMLNLFSPAMRVILTPFMNNFAIRLRPFIMSRSICG